VNRRFRSALILLSLLASGALCLPWPASRPLAVEPAAGGGVNISGIGRILVAAPHDQIEPAIFGNWIVYTDFRNGNADIYLWDLGQTPNRETRITDGPQDERTPDISGRIIVYVDQGPETGGGDIMARTIGGGGRVVAAEPGSAQTDPAIDGHLVAWVDDRDGNREIYARDLRSGLLRRLTETPDTDEVEPAVDAGRVVFARIFPDGTCQIFMTEFATLATVQITSGDACYRRPDIDGRHVVYDGTPGASQDVIVRDLLTGHETQVVLAGIQRDAHISGLWLSAEKVAMVPVTNRNVKVYNIPEEFPFEPSISERANEYAGDIHGKRVAYETDERGNLDIGLYPFAVFGENDRPVADAGIDAARACSDAAGADVSLDGSASFDPEGDPITFHWSGPSGGASGMTPVVRLPFGTSLVSLVVNDGGGDSEPDDVEVRVVPQAKGLLPAMDGLVEEGEPMPAPGRAHKAGSILPLRLWLGCGDRTLGDGDVMAPRLVALVGPAGPVDPAAIGLGSGGGSGAFRFAGDAWQLNLGTRGLVPGAYRVVVEIPGGARMTAPLALR
jgi:beta propeller repeat protein